MTIEIDGTQDSTLRARIAAKLRAALTGMRPKAVGMRVGFADENGPKGGVDIRCGLTVELPRRPRLHAGATAASPRLAFEIALEILERQLAREREWRREARRRPKKYYLAKRLLTSESPGGSAHSGSAGETRSRPRRSA
jgi:ribosome-associated translation inhibitor RaiA